MSGLAWLESNDEVLDDMPEGMKRCCDEAADTGDRGSCGSLIDEAATRCPECGRDQREPCPCGGRVDPLFGCLDCPDESSSPGDSPQIKAGALATGASMARAAETHGATRAPVAHHLQGTSAGHGAGAEPTTPKDQTVESEEMVADTVAGLRELADLVERGAVLPSELSETSTVDTCETVEALVGQMMRIGGKWYCEEYGSDDTWVRDMGMHTWYLTLEECEAEAACAADPAARVARVRA